MKLPTCLAGLLLAAAVGGGASAQDRPLATPQAPDVRCWPETAAGLAAPQIFERLDLDDSTNLSEAEYAPCAGGPAPAFRQLDGDADGRVSREEFIAAALDLEDGLAAGRASSVTADPAGRSEQRAGAPPRLGVEIQPLDEKLAQALGLESTEGALVAGVRPGSPAAEAGLAPGDVIVSFAGKSIREAGELPGAVQSAPLGETLTLTTLRDGRERQVEVKLARPASAAGSSSAEPLGDEPEPLGVTLAPLTRELRERLDLGALADGAVIVQVQQGSRGEQAGLRAGDVVVQVGQVPIVTPEDVVNQMEQMRSKAGEGVLLRINRDGRHRFVAVPG